MTISAIMFYIISAFILVCGLLAVTTRKIFRSAIYLLGSLVGIAGMYFWLEVEFIAAVQIVVYVGGIVVLIIFSIFLTQQSGMEMLKTPLLRDFASIFATLFGFTLSCLLIHHHGFEATAVNFNSDVERIGTQMLSTAADGYVLPFEVVSMLLLAAMIGCIVIALKTSPTEK